MWEEHVFVQEREIMWNKERQTSSTFLLTERLRQQRKVDSQDVQKATTPPHTNKNKNKA